MLCHWQEIAPVFVLMCIVWLTLSKPLINYTSPLQGMGSCGLLSLTAFAHSAVTNCWAVNCLGRGEDRVI